MNIYVFFPPYFPIILETSSGNLFVNGDFFLIFIHFIIFFLSYVFQSEAITGSFITLCPIGHMNSL